jgi:NAD(P)H dehydrogenase (quinone)
VKHAVIVGHPNRDSFTLTMARAYCDAVKERGGNPVLRDLYRMDFDPCLKAEEIPRPGGFTPGAQIIEERELIGDAEVFCFVYPLWFNLPPAILKGYIDRVFGMGFGFGPIQDGGNQPLLSNRRMITLSSSGAPDQWLHDSGAWSPIRTLVDGHFASVCGLQVVDHVHFGGIVKNMVPEAVEDCQARVRQAVAEHF